MRLKTLLLLLCCLCTAAFVAACRVHPNETGCQLFFAGMMLFAIAMPLLAGFYIAKH